MLTVVCWVVHVQAVHLPRKGDESQARPSGVERWMCTAWVGREALLLFVGKKWSKRPSPWKSWMRRPVFWSTSWKSNCGARRKIRRTRRQDFKNIFNHVNRGAWFIQKQKDCVLCQKEEVFWVSGRGFTDQKGFHQCRYHCLPTASPSPETLPSGTAIYNSQAQSALDLSAEEVLTQGQECCERVTSERLKMWNPLSSGFENPPLCDKKTLYSASNFALSGAPSATGLY